MPDTFLTPSQFLDHWQGHRRLTRRFIVAFPEKELFEFSVGGMRPFAQLATEMFKMAIPTLEGISTGHLELRQVAHAEDPRGAPPALGSTPPPSIDRIFPTGAAGTLPGHHEGLRPVGQHRLRAVCFT